MVEFLTSHSITFLPLMVVNSNVDDGNVVNDE
jgi:hypothetical protein